MCKRSRTLSLLGIPGYQLWPLLPPGEKSVLLFFKWTLLSILASACFSNVQTSTCGEAGLLMDNWWYQNKVPGSKWESYLCLRRGIWFKSSKQWHGWSLCVWPALTHAQWGTLQYLLLSRNFGGVIFLWCWYCQLPMTSSAPSNVKVWTLEKHIEASI